MRDKGVNKKNLELLKRFKKGDKEALTELIIFNYDYIANIARNNKDAYYPIEIDDIIQDYMIGVYEAAKRFEIRKDNNFFSYAFFHMHKIALKDAYNNQVVRIPYNIYWDAKKNRRTRTNKDFEDLIIFRFWNMLSNFDEDEFKNVGYEHDFFTKIFEKDFRDIIFNKIKTLTKREKMVLRMHYGFANGKVYSLEETGKILGVTRERVRQIDVKAIAKIKRYFKIGG